MSKFAPALTGAALFLATNAALAQTKPGIPLSEPNILVLMGLGVAAIAALKVFKKK